MSETYLYCISYIATLKTKGEVQSSEIEILLHRKKIRMLYAFYKNIIRKQTFF